MPFSITRCETRACPLRVAAWQSERKRLAKKKASHSCLARGRSKTLKETQREVNAYMHSLCEVPSFVKFTTFLATTALQRNSPKRGWSPPSRLWFVRPSDLRPSNEHYQGITLDLECQQKKSPRQNEIHPSLVGKEIKGGKTKPQGGFVTPNISSIPPLQAKTKILSILSKTPHAPPLPARGKPRHTLAQKATRRAPHPSQLLATTTPNAHTTHATFHTTSPCPRLRPAEGNRRQSAAAGPAACKTKKRPFPVLPRPGPGRIPPEATSPQPASSIQKTLACFPHCPRLAYHSPASSARQGRGGKRKCQRRTRHPPASAPPQALADLSLRPRRTYHTPASSARQGRGGKPRHQRRKRRLSASGDSDALAGFGERRGGFAEHLPRTFRLPRLFRMSAPGSRRVRPRPLGVPV